MSSELDATSSRWYKEPWAWIIIGILLVSILHGLSLLFAGIKFGDSLVVDNYYDAGVGINKSLEREALAQKLGVTAQLNIDTERNQVELTLAGGFTQLPQHLVLNIISPTIPEQDRQVILQPKSGTHVYTGIIADEVKGRRFIELLGQEQGKDWRLFEDEEVAAGKTIALGDE